MLLYINSEITLSERKIPEATDEMKKYLQKRLPLLSEVVIPGLLMTAFIARGNGWTLIAYGTLICATHLLAYCTGHKRGWFVHKNQ